MEDTANFEIIEDFRQSSEYGNYLKFLKWKVLKAGGINVFIKMLGPVGICKIQRHKGKIDEQRLNKILKENRVIRVIYEPETEGAVPPGTKINNEPLLGTKTLRANLKQSEKELFESFRKDCRYAIRKLSVASCQLPINRFEEFYEIWRKSGKRLNIWIPPKNEYEEFIKCFGEKVFCLTINNQAGCLVVMHRQTAFYYYAGATHEGTRANMPYLVVWEAMKEAKRKGARVWDFEGIYDARWPYKRWLGFSHFKKSFGGKEIEFPGSFAKWRWPF